MPCLAIRYQVQTHIAETPRTVAKVPNEVHDWPGCLRQEEAGDQKQC